MVWAGKKAARGSRRHAAIVRSKKKRSLDLEQVVTQEASAQTCGPQRVAWARHEATVEERRRVVVMRQKSEARKGRRLALLAPLQATTKTAYLPDTNVVAKVETTYVSKPENVPSASTKPAPDALAADHTTSADQTHTEQTEDAVRQEAHPITGQMDSPECGPANVSAAPSFKCAKHCILRHWCTECGSGMTDEEVQRCCQKLHEIRNERLLGRRERVRLLNAKAEEPRLVTSQRPRTVTFDLHDVPKPVKDREFLYRDFLSSNEGMVQQWSRRFHKRHRNETTWRLELDALAARRGWRADGLEHTERRIEE